MLQQLAVLVYYNYTIKAKSQISGATLVNSGTMTSEKSKGSLLVDSKEKKIVTSSYLKSVKISIIGDNGERLSLEGDKFALTTGLGGHDDVWEINIGKRLKVNFIDITPIEWVNTEFSDIPAFRLELLGYSEVTSNQGRLAPILDDKILINSVRDMEDVLSALISLVTKVNSFEQAEKARRQEEMKRVSCWAIV